MGSWLVPGPCSDGRGPEDSLDQVVTRLAALDRDFVGCLERVRGLG